MVASSNGSNSNDEWYTPIEVLDLVREVFGGIIDLDPYSCLKANQRVLARNYFDKNKDGHNQRWSGKVFLNPPYSSGNISKALKKAIHELDYADEMIILTNSGTDTKWNRIISKGLQAYTIGRIHFVYPSGEIAGVPSRGQVFTYFGNNPEKFIEVFTRSNFCWIPNMEIFK